MTTAETATADPVAPAPEPTRLRDRLAALLDEYDARPRADEDSRLAAYVRGCLSARTALELRVGAATRGGSAHATRFPPDPRPDATLRLATDVCRAHGARLPRAAR